MNFNTIEEAISDIKAGKVIIVIDDEKIKHQHYMEILHDREVPDVY